MTESGPNLSQLAFISRQAIKFGGIFLVLFMVGRTFLIAFTAYWKAAHPAPPPPPTVGFGILPSLRFPIKDDDEKPTSYKLETATGGVGTFPDRAKVFLMTRSVPSLLDDQKAKEIAASMNFLFAPETLGDTEYRFSKSTPLESFLTIDTVTHHFELTSDYMSRPELLSDNDIPDQVQAVTTVKSLLSRADLLADDVSTASGETLFMKAIGTQLTPALSFSDADYIKVDLNRTPIDGVYRAYTPEGDRGIISAVVSGFFTGSDAVMEMQYDHQLVDYAQYHTYPLRDAQMAWKLLQSGEGYVAQKGEFDNAVIRNVYLGYYDDTEEQDYLQPIYVFEGDGGFVGYVSAVDTKYSE